MSCHEQKKSSGDEKFYIDYFKRQIVYEIVCRVFLALHNRLRNITANKVETVIGKNVDSFVKSCISGVAILSLNKEIT